MYRLFTTGPVGVACGGSAQKDSFTSFVESNKGMKKSEFRNKFTNQFLLTLPSDLQAKVKAAYEEAKKAREARKAAMAGLSAPAKAVAEKYKAIRDNDDLTVEEEHKQLEAHMNSAEFKAVAGEMKSKGML
ncbi:hypothetical protein AAVH_03575 [Aphelenchoides avenae]|nr:hypothetical protein AAVH_03575 [Aphelenchus avenae]